MAAPETATTLNFSGQWVMSKSLSDDTDEVLTLQGVSWLTRKAIGYASITISMKHYKDEEGVEHVDSDQTLGGGIPGTREERTLWNKTREHTDHVFGTVTARSLRVKLEDLEVEFLKQGWTDDSIQNGFLRSVAESVPEKNGGRTWKADQIWGFAIINGERRHTRRLTFTGPKGEELERRLVYDYVGPLA